MKKREMNVEKLKPRWSHVAVVVLILSVILAACGPSATPEATAVPPTGCPTHSSSPTAVPPTAVPPTEVPPTPVPDPAYYEGEPVAVVPAGVPGGPMVTAAYNTAIFGGRALTMSSMAHFWVLRLR